MNLNADNQTLDLMKIRERCYMYNLQRVHVHWTAQIGNTVSTEDSNFLHTILYKLQVKITKILVHVVNRLFTISNIMTVKI